MTVIRLQYLEYGKPFGPAGATGFDILASSDEEFGKLLNVLREELKYPDKTAFHLDTGRFTVIMLAVNKPLLDGYLFVQIQSRKEDEIINIQEAIPDQLNDSSKRKPLARYFSQVHYTFLPPGIMDSVLANKSQIIVQLIESAAHLEEYGSGNAISSYRLKDYYTRSGEGYQTTYTGALAIIPDDSPQKPFGSGVEIAELIANALINLYEDKKPQTPRLAIRIANEVKDQQHWSVHNKALITQLVQHYVYPRLGPLTFAFDHVTERVVNLILTDGSSTIAGQYDKMLSVEEMRNYTAGKFDYIGMAKRIGEETLYKPRLFNLLQIQAFSIEEVFKIHNILAKGLEYSDRAEAVRLLSRYFSQPSSEAELNVALSCLKTEELKGVLANPSLEESACLLILNYSGRFCDWNIRCFWQYYLAIPVERQNRDLFIAALHTAIKASRAQDMSVIPEDRQLQLLHFLLNHRIELGEPSSSTVRFADPDGPGPTVIEALLMNDVPLGKQVLEGELTNQPALLEEVLAAILEPGDLMLLEWLLLQQGASISERQFVEALLQLFEKEVLSSQNLDVLLRLLNAYNESSRSSRDSGVRVLTSVHRSKRFPVLRHKLLELAQGNAQLAEFLFFDEIIHEKTFEPFSEYLGSIQARLDPALIQATCTDRFQYLILDPSKRPENFSIERICEKNPTCETLVFRFRVQNDSQLSAKDIEEQINKIDTDGFAKQRLDILLRENPDSDVIRQISPGSAVKWLQREKRSSLRAILSELELLDDDFVDYFLGRELGYSNPTKLFDLASKWYERPVTEHDLPRTYSYLSALHELAGLSKQPTRLTQDLVRLLAQQITWDRISANSVNMLVEQLVLLKQENSGAPCQHITRELENCLNHEELFMRYLEHSVGFRNYDLLKACDWWVSTILPNAKPPERLRRFLETGKRLKSITVSISVSRPLIDLLAGNETWSSLEKERDRNLVSHIINLAKHDPNGEMGRRSAQLVQQLLDSIVSVQDLELIPTEQLEHLRSLTAEDSDVQRLIEARLSPPGRSVGNIPETGRPDGGPTRPNTHQSSNDQQPPREGQLVFYIVIVMMVVVIILLAAAIILVRFVL